MSQFLSKCGFAGVGIGNKSPVRKFAAIVSIYKDWRDITATVRSNFAYEYRRTCSTVAETFRGGNEKDLPAILGFYEQSEELLVFVEGPRWRTLGFKNVSKGWTDFIYSAITVKHCEWVDDLRARVVDGMGIVAGISELTVDINGVEKKIRFRGTFVFEKGTDGFWRVLHEHLSQPAENPYGIRRLA